MTVTRRDFIKAASVAALGMPTIIPSSVLGRNGKVAPSNRIVMAGIGLGPRGRLVLRECFLKQSDVQFIAIADVQSEQREIIRRIVNHAYGNEDCIKYRDMTDVLERKDVDAVLIATGSRWHALASVLAARAGKDVYCEKPSSMSIQESIDLARYVGASGQIFQAGMQRRNIDNYQYAAALAHGGRLGRLHTVYAGLLWRSSDAPYLPEEPEPDPEVCDWDRWLGPAAWRPYNRTYLLEWKRMNDLIGGAGLPEWGSHTVDLCQWALQADTTAPSRYVVDGDEIIGHYASGQKVVMRKAGFKGEGIWEAAGTCPVRFEGDEGWVEASDRGDLMVSDNALLENWPGMPAIGTNPMKHVREFLDAVKTRQKTSGNEAVAGQTHIVCHAAAIAWQLKRELHYDPSTHVFANDEEATRMRFWPHREPWSWS